MPGKYFFRYRTPDYSYPTLVELTAQEHRDEVTKAGPAGWPRYERTTAEKAHHHVREGGYHETGLYLDGSRIRYARDGY